MDYIKKAIYGPTAQEKYRACIQTLRRNKRSLERQMNEMNNTQKRTVTLIKSSAKKNDKNAVKIYAKELVNIRKGISRLSASKATLDSIEFKLNEQQQLIKINGSMQKSTSIMLDLNSLVKLPQMSRIVQDLSRELTKSGIIDEMVFDILDADTLSEEDEFNSESEDINEVINEIVGNGKVDSKLDSIKSPTENIPETQEPSNSVNNIEESDDDDQLLLNMRQRLNALQE